MKKLISWRFASFLSGTNEEIHQYFHFFLSFGTKCQFFWSIWTNFFFNWGFLGVLHHFLQVPMKKSINIFTFFALLGPNINFFGQFGQIFFQILVFTKIPINHDWSVWGSWNFFSEEPTYVSILCIKDFSVALTVFSPGALENDEKIWKLGSNGNPKRV